MQPIAQLDTIESLLQSAQEVVAKIPINNRDDARITLQRARAFIVLAEIRWERGDISGMHALAERAHDIVALPAPSADSNPEALHLLARSTSLIGLFYAMSQQPDTNRALALYKRALDQLEQLEKRFDQTRRMGDDWRWLRSLALHRQAMGDLLLNKLAKVDEANESYRASINTFVKLKQTRPGDAQIDYELAWAANKFGDVLWLQGKDDPARRQFEAAAAGIAALGESRLWENLKWRQSLSIVHNNVGLVLRNQMRYEEAISAFGRAETEIKKLLDRDPVHGTWLSVLAWTYDNIGDTRIRWARKLQEEMRLDGVRDRLDTAKNIRSQLVQRASDNARWQIEPAITEANIAVYDGTTKEFRKDFIGAAYDFVHAAQLNPAWVNDERREPMILRTIEFLEWAGLAFRQGKMPAAGEEQLKRAVAIAEQHVASAINHEAFSAIVIELNKLLVENPR